VSQHKGNIKHLEHNVLTACQQVSKNRTVWLCQMFEIVLRIFIRQADMVDNKQ